MTTKHTPGPWSIDPEGEVAVSIEGRNGEVICDVRGASNDALCDANARLIAAAPDLLAALEDLREELRAHIRFNVKKHYRLMVADVAADKAICKAKGAL